MSLNVYLTVPRPPEPGDHNCNCERCFDRAPTTTRLFEANITHNVNGIADAVGAYKALWRPDENGMAKARDLIEPLRAGLALLEAKPEAFKHLEPKNGWGSVAALTEFIRAYLAACEEYPDADVEVSR